MKESTEVIDFDMDKVEGLTGKDGHLDDMAGEKLRVEQQEPVDNSLLRNRYKADSATKAVIKPAQIECIDADIVNGEAAAVAANVISNQAENFK